MGSPMTPVPIQAIRPAVPMTRVYHNPSGS